MWDSEISALSMVGSPLQCSILNGPLGLTPPDSDLESVLSPFTQRVSKTLRVSTTSQRETRFTEAQPNTVQLSCRAPGSIPVSGITLCEQWDREVPGLSLILPSSSLLTTPVFVLMSQV